MPFTKPAWTLRLLNVIGRVELLGYIKFMLRCRILTPERTLCDRTADFVVLTLPDGELGIAPGRAPLVALLGCGELRIRQGEHTERYYLEEGFAEVHENVVSVLTERALPAAELDVEVAAEQLRAAFGRQPRTAEDFAARDAAVAKARAQLRVAQRSKQPVA